MQSYVPFPASSEDFERRDDYRVCYSADQLDAGPHIELGGQVLPVLDISEHGICFERPPNHSLQPGERLIAPVYFGHQRGCPTVEGVVVRITEQYVALRLESGFDFLLVAREHLFHSKP